MVHSISESVTQVNSVTRFAPTSVMGLNERMKTNEEIRVENLRALIREAGSEELLASRYKCTPAFIKQMSRGYKDSDTGVRKGIGTVAARKLEECMSVGRSLGLRLAARRWLARSLSERPPSSTTYPMSASPSIMTIMVGVLFLCVDFPADPLRPAKPRQFGAL